MSCSHQASGAERRDAFRLPALGSSVADARRRMQARLFEWGVDDELNDDAGLVLCELLTDAVRHSRGGTVSCRYRVEAHGLVRVEVADARGGQGEPRLPAAGAAVADVDGQDADRGAEECGRGLLLVTALSRAWGVRPAGDGAERVLWAELCGGGTRG